MKIRPSNRDSNESGAKSDRFTSMTHKIMMKRQIILKFNVGMSLMFFLFWLALESYLIESEKILSSEIINKVKKIHIKSLRRLEKLLFFAGTSNSIAKSKTCKNVQRWNHCAAKIN